MNPSTHGPTLGPPWAGWSSKKPTWGYWCNPPETAGHLIKLPCLKDVERNCRSLTQFLLLVVVCVGSGNANSDDTKTAFELSSNIMTLWFCHSWRWMDWHGEMSESICPWTQLCSENTRLQTERQGIFSWQAAILASSPKAIPVWHLRKPPSFHLPSLRPSAFSAWENRAFSWKLQKGALGAVNANMCGFPPSGGCMVKGTKNHNLSKRKMFGSKIGWNVTLRFLTFTIFVASSPHQAQKTI